MPAPIITCKKWLSLQDEARQRANCPPGQPYTGAWHETPDRPRPSCIRQWPSTLPIYPRSAWPYLIKEQAGTFLANIRGDKLPPHDQDGRSRCWVHGSVRALEILRLYQCQKPLLLSPDSVAYPIEGTRDRGGWPSDACAQLAKAGACAQTLWPENDLAPTNADPNWQADALKHTLLQWVETTTFEQQMTLLLHRIPIAAALSWWGHLVCFLEPVLLDNGGIGIGFDNSWGANWGENGYAILDEESATAASGSFAPISLTFSPT